MPVQFYSNVENIFKFDVCVECVGMKLLICFDFSPKANGMYKSRIVKTRHGALPVPNISDTICKQTNHNICSLRTETAKYCPVSRWFINSHSQRFKQAYHAISPLIKASETANITPFWYIENILLDEQESQFKYERLNTVTSPTLKSCLPHFLQQLQFN